jgi:hypothetical protein
MVLKIDSDVRAWKTEYDKVRDGGNYSHHVALALSDVDEKTQLLRRHVAPGVAVLEVLEERRDVTTRFDTNERGQSSETRRSARGRCEGKYSCTSTTREHA